MNDKFSRELHRLYADSSKHSVYQSIPNFVSLKLGYSEKIDEKWRGDRPRLAWLLEHRTPQAGERWCDLGANTGFFTLSLAYRYPQTNFTAIEANAGHANFIRRVVGHFELKNVEVMERTVGIESFSNLPESDFLLHMNVLHHAGHDFDAHLVHDVTEFPDYAIRYLELLHTRARELFFQMGSNWGGDKKHPIVAVRDDVGKLELFSGLLAGSGWTIDYVSYAARNPDKNVAYRDFCSSSRGGLDKPDKAIGQTIASKLDEFDLDCFPGEFYRRPLFLCRADNVCGLESDDE